LPIAANVHYFRHLLSRTKLLALLTIRCEASQVQSGWGLYDPKSLQKKKSYPYLFPNFLTKMTLCLLFVQKTAKFHFPPVFHLLTGIRVTFLPELLVLVSVVARNIEMAA